MRGPNRWVREMTGQPAAPHPTDDVLPHLLAEVGRLHQFIQSVMETPTRKHDSSGVLAHRTLTPHVTAAERRVLVALCRPLLEGPPFTSPASNHEIAEELFLSLAGVKSHVRSLFDRFGVGALPQNQKRAELARRALQLGSVTLTDL